MKIFLTIAAAIIALVLAAAGGFWGGIQYQTSIVDRAQANFENTRGPLGALPGGGAMPDGQRPDASQLQGAFTARSGAAGSIKSLEGDTLMLSTAQDVTTVNLTADTVILKTVTGSTADLEPGLRIMVTGERSDDGLTITATQISIISGDASLPIAPGQFDAPAATPQP